ncbi:TIGR00341 family protein [Patescibacteria group bacterium]
MPTKTKQPRLFSLRPEQRRRCIDQLLDVSLLTPDYLLTLGLSVTIVAIGLLMDSASVIIGGMVVAPLLSPIMTLAMGIVLADFRLLSNALRTLAFSLLIVFGLSVLLALFYPSPGLNGEILERSRASLAHFIIAVAAGVLAAFAFTRPEKSTRLTGIAVSVALLPPVVTSALGIALADWSLMTNAFAIFILNLMGIVFSAIIIFSLMGFYNSRRDAEKILEKEEKEAEQEWEGLKPENGPKEKGKEKGKAKGS